MRAKNPGAGRAIDTHEELNIVRDSIEHLRAIAARNPGDVGQALLQVADQIERTAIHLERSLTGQRMIRPKV
jgi:hypothetical protein